MTEKSQEPLNAVTIVVKAYGEDWEQAHADALEALKKAGLEVLTSDHTWFVH